MVSDLLFYELALFGLLRLCISCIMHGQTIAPQRIRRHPSLLNHPASAAATRSRFPASPASPTVRPVSRRGPSNNSVRLR